MTACICEQLRYWCGAALHASPDQQTFFVKGFHIALELAVRYPDSAEGYLPGLRAHADPPENVVHSAHHIITGIPVNEQDRVRALDEMRSCRP